MSRSNLLLFMASTVCLVLSAGCPGSGIPGFPNPAALEGIWTVERGAVSSEFTFTVAGGGEVTTETSGGELMPLDKAEFPELLHPLVDQWNAALADLNARLDAAMPDSVLIEFPSIVSITITNADDAAKTGTGLFDGQKAEFLLIGDLSGQGDGSDQGGGAVLQASTITGTFDRDALTAIGEIARTMAVVLIGPNQNGAAFTAQISVTYTATRTGDLPEQMTVKK